MRCLLVVPLVLLASCGDASTSGSTASTAMPAPLTTTTVIADGTDTTPPITAQLPATTIVVQPTLGSSPPVMPDPVEVVEPCPQSVRFTASGDGSPMMAESSRLEPMLGTVLAYGGEHPDEFGTYGLIWHAEGDASVFISFTGHLDEHRSALAGMVAFPDELIVCQVALSGQASQQLSAALNNELAGRYSSISQGAGPVEIVLAATEEALARELVDRYGDAV